KPNFYNGVLPDRGILRGPPGLPLFTLTVNYSTHPSTSVGWATGSPQNTPLHPTSLVGSSSHRKLLLPLNVFLLRVQAWLPTSLTGSLMVFFSLFCYMALTSSSPPRACLQRWRFTGTRFSIGQLTASEPRPPPYWPQRPGL